MRALVTSQLRRVATAVGNPWISEAAGRHGLAMKPFSEIETLPLEKEPYCRQRTELVLGDRIPMVAPDAFVAPSAVLVGDVNLYNSVSVWDGCVLRGDLNRIRVMCFTNIQDRTVIHAARKSPTGLSAATSIGEYVTIGPGCIIRSCKIGDRCVIGERSVLMEGSVIEKNSILEAGSVLPPAKYVATGEFWGGNPAKFIRKCTQDEIDETLQIAVKAFELNYRHNLEYLPHGTAWRKAQRLREAVGMKYINLERCQNDIKKRGRSVIAVSRYVEVLHGVYDCGVETCSGASITFQVQHRWSVFDFTNAGTLTAPLSVDGTVAAPFKFSRSALTDSELRSLTECAYKNGVYSIRVYRLPKETSSSEVIASVPAYCLLSSHFYESLFVDLTTENHLIGLDYRTQCNNQSVGMEAESGANGFVTDSMDVGFRYPQTALSLSMEELLRRVEASEEIVDGRPGQPQKPQKSFLQQNWVFVLAGAVIVMQIAGNLAAPPEEQPNQINTQMQGRR